MSRWLAGAFAVICVIGSAVAVWLVLGDDGGKSARESKPAERRAELPERQREDSASPRGVRFTVSVSGDLLMHGPLLERALANGGGSYDFAPFFAELGPYVQEPELAICHVETPMGPGPPATYPIFNTPMDLAESIRKTGWDACSTASNHALDQGTAGIAGTAEALDREGIAHTGSFASERARARPTMIEVEGVEIALVSYTDSTNGIPAPTEWALNEYAASDPASGARQVLADARYARRRGAEAVLVNVHWGTEYAAAPNASQLELAERLTESRLITAVFGQHPHVVQPIRRINGKYVVFSEGNLVSNQSAAVGLPAESQDGLIALLRVKAVGDRVRVRRVDYLPTWVRPGDYVVLPATPGADPANADALSASRARTVSTVGSGDGIAPIE